ncbi:MAG TPA: OmpH family outer membrane protein [Chthoniobacterales bacterium]|nr:OmpH family outer membrane protein [Chthoniobacterales bacterium]
MKKFFLLALAAGLAFPVAGFADVKVGTVDMNRAFKEYNKTKDAEKKINEARDAAKKEFDDRADGYKKALEELNKLQLQLDAPALSADAKTQKGKERDEKVANIKNMERELKDFQTTRERQLQEQMKRMLEGLVKEITDIVLERVKTNGMDFVFDKSAASMSGVPFLIYSKDSVDFTGDVITTLNKKASSEKPAVTPAPGAATSPAASATPAKAPAKP